MVRKQHRESINIDFITPQGSGFLVDFTEALVGLGNSFDARTVIETAISQSKHEGLLWHLPELLRIRGELLGRQFDDQSISAAEQSLNEALVLSQQQDASFWQLRAATSLARLNVAQGRYIEAQAILAPVCAAYSDEPAFSDLEIARALLAQISADPSSSRA
jgi:predicted ATPase